jgi:hypothetical protein
VAHSSRPVGHRGLLVPALYVTLGSALVGTRLVGLGQSFWHDEVVAVEDFIRAGPREILAGPDLSHELFSLLAWATSRVVGESEIALRLWSVMPFMAGVALVTAWLHTRRTPIAGLLFLFLATVSPLLLDITRQARGYGLAFLAMSIVIVAAVEAGRSGKSWTIVALCAGGVIGTWTLPQVGIAYVATGAVLLADRELRRRTALGLGASLLAIGAWYSPHIGEVRDATRIEDGIQIDTLWLVTAPIDQILFPALLWIDGTALRPGLVWLPLLLAAALVMGSSPLMHERRTALVLASGVVATILVLWLGRAYIVPRYLSYLLVPLLVVLATGMAAIFERLASRRPAIVRTVASIVVLGLLAARFVVLAPEVVRQPREAYKDAAAVIERAGPVTVLAYVRNREGLEYYLERTVRHLGQVDEVVASVCGSPELVAYVMQPFALASVDVPCLARTGVRHFRFGQYARGDEMDVWLVPPGR